MKTLWETNKPLTAVGILMMPVFVLSLIGLFIDPRIITGMPAWLKSAKFAISIAIYTLTLAWVFQYLPEWPRVRSVTGWITSVVMVLEMGIIGIQAARGTTSHFNVGMPLDAVLFTIMGVAILVAWLALIAIAVALFRQKFTDPIMGWALRMGVLITVLGAATGGLMTVPTSTNSRRRGRRITCRSPARTRWERRTADPEFRVRAGARNTGTCAFHTSLGCTQCRSYH
jgi:hypothetical protein